MRKPDFTLKMNREIIKEENGIELYKNGDVYGWTGKQGSHTYGACVTVDSTAYMATILKLLGMHAKECLAKMELINHD